MRVVETCHAGYPIGPVVQVFRVGCKISQLSKSHRLSEWVR